MINHSTLFGPLSVIADTVVRDVLQHGCNGPITRIPPPRKETAAVAAVLLGAFPHIARRWSPHLAAHGYSATFTGVFCHAAPMVTFTDSHGSTAASELADLLVVVDDYGSAAKPQWQDRRANLIQAKPANGRFSIGSTGKPWRQLDLYTRWPAFTFDSKEYVQRQLVVGQTGTPPQPDDSGRYSGIHYTSGSWMQVVPSSGMTTHTGTPLGTFMAGMLFGTPACGRPTFAGANDDWSTTIDELLRVTAGQTMSSTVRPWAHGQPKQIASAFSDTGLMDLGRGSSLQLVARDPPPADGEPERDRSPEGGVSVLHVGVVRAADGD